jgi:hypothetical protein
VWVGTPFPAPLPRPRGPPAARSPGGPLPRALLVPHPCAGLQSQKAARAQLEGAVGTAAPRRHQPVSRVAQRGTHEGAWSEGVEGTGLGRWEPERASGDLYEDQAI